MQKIKNVYSVNFLAIIKNDFIKIAYFKKLHFLIRSKYSDKNKKRIVAVNTLASMRWQQLQSLLIFKYSYILEILNFRKSNKK